MASLSNNINSDLYSKECSLECIESMEIIFGKKAVLNFCMCNAWKYIWLWKNKNGKEDLYKAEWYMDRAFKYPDQLSNEGQDMLYRMNDYIRSVI